MTRVGYRSGRCPRFAATEALKRINGRWKTPILILLAEKPRRYGQLRRELPEISDKVLAQQLDALQEDGLVDRSELVVDPPKVVEYRLSREGERARPVLAALADWGQALVAISNPSE